MKTRANSLFLETDEDGNIRLYPVISSLVPLISLGGVASPNNNGAVVIPAVSGQRIIVYDCGYEAVTAGLHYFYFGTSTTPTTSIFLARTTAAPILKSFVHPRVGGSGQGVYLYSAVNDPAIPFDIGYDVVSVNT